MQAACIFYPASAHRHGAVGVAVASLIGDVVCGFFVFPALASSFLKVSASKVYAQIFSATLVLVSIGGVAFLMSVFLRGWWSVWAFVLVGMGLAYPMLRFVIGKPEARQGLEILRAVLGWRAR